MTQEPQRGKVLRFDEHVGLGTVLSESGDQFLFHCTQIADGTRTIEAGTEVRFKVVPRHKGTYEAYELIEL